jgi:hypothetical protein
MRFLLAGLLMTTSALAQSEPPPAVDLVAIAFAGIADGVSTRLVFPGIAEQTGPGQFAVTGAEGQTLVSVVEADKCVFVLTFATAGQPSIGIHLDANKLSGISVTPNGVSDGVPQYSLLFSGAPGRVVIDLNTGPVTPPDGPSQIVTSLPQADIEAAILALRTTYCPGLAA